ncbi:hypothetical protein LSAT2_029013 [Lamellibrachia satsuma]|nr:hypothetical protein LSAT2_029013 [Lamellibrachia satsuma]
MPLFDFMPKQQWGGLRGSKPTRSGCVIPDGPVEATPANGMLRSADAHLLEVPRSKLCTQGDRAFSHAAPCLWNNLPLAVRTADCHNSFKKQLKTLLFKRAFSL